MRAPPPRPAPIPFVAEKDAPPPGTPVAIAPGLYRLLAPNAGPFTYTGTNTYIVEADRGWVVIDPGPDRQDHISAIIALTGGNVGSILLTHTHRDHSAAAPALVERTGAPIIAGGRHPVRQDEAPPALDEGADFVTEPHLSVTDGQTIAAPGRTFTAVATPGHVANHFCFALEDRLFTGDHVMGWSTTVIAPPEGSMTDYLASLDRLIERGDRQILPGHGRPIDDPAPFLAALKAHRLWREAVIRHLLRPKQAMSAEALRDAAYDGLPSALATAALLTTRAHLDRLCALGQARRTGEGYVSL